MVLIAKHEEVSIWFDGWNGFEVRHGEEVIDYFWSRCCGDAAKAFEVATMRLMRYVRRLSNYNSVVET